MLRSLTIAEDEQIHILFEKLLNTCTRCNETEDREAIEKAFKIAYDAHKGMRRRSGEPYIVHPLEVARIVTEEIGLGVKSIISALLHDVVEDTEYTLEEVENNFGPKVASIVDGLTKIGEIYDKDSTFQAENFRKMLLTLSDDVRVILIKLADRLHNMRTLDAMPPDKQVKIASETIYLYAPLAHRMGLYMIKTELEDLSLRYRYPDSYFDILNKINESEHQRLMFINKFVLPIINKLNDLGIKYDISGRPKSVYSIWNKMQTKRVSFEEIYDLFAVRIVFEPEPDTPEKTQCWNIYSIITDIYTPRPDRLRDWVSTPKANGYEALHLTVMGPEGRWVEVQVRSTRMDDIAERGFAAHWKYKKYDTQESELDKWLRRIREMLNSNNSSALEFMDDFKLNLFSSEIHVFTPKGDLKTLPKGSVILDFAYEIHSQIGNKAIGAKVNHKLVPLNHVLNSGDQVEIITSDKQKTQREWLEVVKTMKAKQSIKNSLKSETRNRIDKGKQILEQKLKEINLHPSSRVMQKLLPAYSVSTKEELYSKIGSEIIKLDDLKKVVSKNSLNKWIRYWELTLGIANTKSNEPTSNNNGFESKPKSSKKTPFVLKETNEGESTSYSIAKCCNPIPGDDVVGYRNIHDIVVIHRSKCPNALKLLSSQSERIVQTQWSMHKILSFLVRISIVGIDKFGIFNQITNVISKELKVNIRNINISAHDGIFEGYLDLYVRDIEDVNNLISKISEIKGIEKVSRIESSED